MNFPFKRLKDREHVPAKEWNKLCDFVAQMMADSKTTRDDIQQAAQAEPFLARIVDREAYESGQSPVYSWVALRQDNEGNHAQHPISMRGDADGYPAYEEHGNPLVPIDGTALVEMKLGPGAYYLFSYNPRETWAKITGSSGALYSWTEVYHAGGTTFSTLTGGRTGTTSVNAARERNGVTGIANDTIVELKRGHCDGAARVIVTRQQVGNDDDEREIQQVRVLDAIGGTFTLTFDGQTTGALAYNINAADLETALEALSTVTACSVTGTGTDVDPFVITFEDDFEEHAFMTPDASALKSDQEWLFDSPTPWDALPNTSVTLSSSQNNYSLAQTMTYIDASSAISITGFAAPSGGGATLRIIKNTNATNAITFPHQSGSSSSANQFHNPNGGDYKIGPHQTGAWIYDPAGQKWQPLWMHTFTVGTTGTDINWVSNGTAHVLHVPNASATARGVVNGLAQHFAGMKFFDDGLTAHTYSSSYGFPANILLKDAASTGDLSVAPLGTIGLDNTSGDLTIFAGSDDDGGGTFTDWIKIVLSNTDREIQFSGFALGSPDTALALSIGGIPGVYGTTGGGDTVTGGIITALGSGTTLADGDYGDVTVGGSGTTFTIDNDAVTYAKIQNVSAASRLLGRGSASGAGDVEEITLGAGLTMTGTSLSASGVGDVTAAANIADNAIVRGDGGAKGIQGSTITIGDSGILTQSVVTAATNTVTYVINSDHESTGTVAAGYGVGVIFTGHTDIGAQGDLGDFSFKWTDPTNGSEESDFVVSPSQAGSLVEVFRAVGNTGNIHVRNGVRLNAGGNYGYLTGAFSANRTFTFPDATTTVVGTDATQTLTNKSISASQIDSGTMATARLGSGTANATTFLRGDQSYAEPIALTPCFIAYPSGTKTATTLTFTKIDANTESLDTNAFYDNATNYRFTPTIAGKYLFYGLATVNDLGDAAEMVIAFYKNGSEHTRGQNMISGAANSDIASDGLALIDMNGSTDYVEFFARHSHGSDRDFKAGTADCFWMGFRVR